MTRRILHICVATGGVLAVTANLASAGGFALREQSAVLMGSAFAGAASGTALSSSYWNPAAFGAAVSGLSTESSYTAIFADTELSNAATTPGVSGSKSTDIDKIGLLSSSYGAYRINDQWVIGVAITSPFGLSTEADDRNWVGRYHGRAAEMQTVNVAPSLAYDVAPGVTIAAGLQLQYMKLKLWTAAPLLTNPQPPQTSVKLDDTVGVGFTAGILLRPSSGTSIGLGFRSKIDQSLEGNFNFPGGSGPAHANLETPEMVTFSVAQQVAPRVRAMATLEWTNWSRLGTVVVDGVPGAHAGTSAALAAKWDDGWFISGGLEYDFTDSLTLRTGAAFEKSPIRDAGQRLSVLPDSDRVWMALGATYRYSETTSIDVSFAHVMFQDEHLTRDTLSGSGLILNADVENRAEIVSVGVKTRW